MELHGKAAVIEAGNELWRVRQIDEPMGGSQVELAAYVQVAAPDKTTLSRVNAWIPLPGCFTIERMNEHIIRESLNMYIPKITPINYRT